MPDAPESQDVQALRAEVARLRRLIESNPQVPWEADAEGRIVDFSQRWLDLTGLTRVEALGDGWAQAQHPDDLPAMGAAWTRSVRTGEPYDVRHRIRAADGSYRWMRSRAAAWRGERGEIVGWYGSTEDVQAEIDAQEQRTATADALPALVFHLDREFRYTFLNRHAAETFRRSVEAAQGATVREVVGEATYAALRPYLARALAGERTEWAMWIDFPAGRRFVRARFVPTFGAGGEVSGIDVLAADETEARLAEEALRESEARFQAAIGAIGVLWTNSAEGRMEGEQPGWAALTGQSREAYEGYGWAQAVHPDDAPSTIDAWNAAVRERRPFVFEHRVRRHDGEWRRFAIRAVPVFDGKGQVREWVGVHADVTDLRESESQYRQIAQGIPQIVWTTRADGYHDFFNARWYEYTGMARGGERGWEWKDYLHPDDYERTLAVWTRCLETGEPYDVEYRFRRASDGAYRWFLGQALPIRDESGAIVRWFGTLTDIHQGKETERALGLVNAVAVRLSEDLDLRRIVQALTDASTEAVGAQFGAFFYNVLDESGEAFHLYTLSGAPIEAFAPLGLPRATKVFAPTFAAEGVVRSDDITKDPRYGTMGPHFGMPRGHLPVVSYLAVSVVSRTGEVLGGLLFGHPEPGRFTEAHERLVSAFASQASVAMDNARLYARVDAMRAELEDKVKARTVDLQAANDALTAFTYHVSHDLRGPLRAIVSTSRFVQEDYAESLPPEAIDLLDRQAEAANKLGRLIDDLLRLARLSHAPLEKCAVDLSALGREVAADALSAHPDTLVRVEIAEGLTAKADPHLVRLAVGNLIENAVKYSPQGGTVRFGRDADGTFAVSDEGIGIDPRYFGKIFEPFQRLHRDEEFAGTGIGLSNVRQIVERHGGRVWVESALGTGSTFRFTLG